MAKKQKDISWFALTVFKKLPALMSAFEQNGWETYRAFTVKEEFKPSGMEHKTVPLIPRLLFVKCPMAQLVDFKSKNNKWFMYYRDTQNNLPGPIKDEEMEMFRLVTSIMDGNLRVLGEDRPEYHVGEKVRVTQGIYKGAEGYIKRIRRSRDLLVCVEGVAVVAISHLPPEYLEKV